jgi:hypothetical protein
MGTVSEQPPEPDPYRPYPSGWTNEPAPGSGPGQPLVPYGAPGVGGYVLPREHPSGTTVLVLGILSLVVCPITGIFAITTGNRALREINANPGVYTNRQTVVVGRVLGIVGVAVVGGILALYLLFAVVMVGTLQLS